MEPWPWLLLACLRLSLGAEPSQAGKGPSRGGRLFRHQADASCTEAALRESVERVRCLNSLSADDNNTAFYGLNQFSSYFPEEFRDVVQNDIKVAGYKSYLYSRGVRWTVMGFRKIQIMSFALNFQRAAKGGAGLPDLYSAIYLRSKPSKVPKYTPGIRLDGTEKPLPAKFDWRDKNVVTQVRNQGMCGGCWAFSVVGIIESVSAIKGNVLEELSVQHVIDCSYNNSGCRGGSTVSALKWLKQTRVKLVRESEYPFKAQTGLCHYFSRADFGVSVKDYAAYDLSGKEDEMKKMLLEWGPLAVIVDAVSWQDYLGGIIQHHCSSGEPNHAVLITGYDTTGSIPFWIVRNSWGPIWGIDGYVHIKMGSNICGIADEVSAVFI